MDTDTDTDVCTYTNSDHRIMIRLLVLLEVMAAVVRSVADTDTDT